MAVGRRSIARTASALGAVLAAALTTAACDDASRAVPLAEAERFVGAPLPAGAANARAVGESGVDRLVLLRFDAPAAEAEAYARALLGRPPEPGHDPRLAYLGAGLPWWAADAPPPPPGSAGGETTAPANRALKVLLVPVGGEGGGRKVVYVAAFSL